MKEVNESKSLKDITFVPDDDLDQKVRISLDEILERHVGKAEIVIKSTKYLLNINSLSIVMNTLEHLIKALEEADEKGIEPTNDFLFFCSKCGIFGQFFKDIAFLNQELSSTTQILESVILSLENIKSKTKGNKNVTECIKDLESYRADISNLNQIVAHILDYNTKNIHLPITRVAGINEYIQISEKITNAQNLALLLVDLKSMKLKNSNK